jgi:hypothetical protein
MMTGWRDLNGRIPAHHYGAGRRSFFVSRSRCQARVLECQALQAQSGFPVIFWKVLALLLAAVRRGGR